MRSSSRTEPVHLKGRIVFSDQEERGEAWLLDGRLTCERPRHVSVNETVSGTFIPGLVDVHCHIGLGAHGAVDKETAVAQALQDRDSGVLLIRDAGSPLNTQWVHSEEALPELIRCGRHIARSTRYLRNYARELDESHDLTAALTAQVANSDGWTKIVADWIDRSIGDLAPLWEPHDIVEAFTQVHALGGKITAHTFSEEALDALFDAGIDCIEHGTGMTADHISRAAQQHIPVTPTLMQVENFNGFAEQAQEKFPHYAHRMRAMHKRRFEHVANLYEAGVQLLVGTDAGGTISHGRISQECALLAQAGIPARDVVAFASWRAREFFDRPGIQEGHLAHIVGYETDPRDDLTVLKQPKMIVLKGNRIL
ncbi:amidohydrolase family protein [Timonella sp. A28]|uniref:amidohydrolase family protein n=1 Tax=Timonella sp. A28 TaxID=3442640 RepID=UPI003EBAEBAE